MDYKLYIFCNNFYIDIYVLFDKDFCYDFVPYDDLRRN